MERKIVDTTNNPLLYITQPIYPPAKPKMQQTYVRRISTPNNETAQVLPVQDEVVEKQVQVEAIAENITATPLKKNPIEEKTTQRKNQIEEIKQPNETRLIVETEQIKEKPQPQNHVIPASQEEKVNVREPVRKAVIKKTRKKRKLAKQEPIQSKAEPKMEEPIQSIAEPIPKPIPEPVQSIAEPKTIPEPVQSIAEPKPEPVQSRAEAKQEPVQSIAEPKQEEVQSRVELKVEEPIESIAETKRKSIKNLVEPKQEPVQSVTESKQEPVKSEVEPKKDLFKELLKEKLPGLEGVVEGRPVYMQQNRKKVVEQPKPVVAEVPEVIEAPEDIEVPEVEVSALSRVPAEDVIEETLEVEDQESAEKIEAAKERRRMITTFGIRSSIEKGRKAVAPQPKKKLPSPVTINDIKNRIPKEQRDSKQAMDAQENTQQISQNIQEEVKPRQKTFKEMSVEEKVEYLVSLPAAVPKVKCDIRTRETTIQGIIAGYKNGVVQIVQRKKPFRVDLNIAEILGINRKSF